MIRPDLPAPPRRDFARKFRRPEKMMYLYARKRYPLPSQHRKRTVMDKLIYTTFGTCSRAIEIELEGDTVRRVLFSGGCQGNTCGIASLVEGMPVAEVIRRLEGIDCRGKGTSCPDQLARALRTMRPE